MGHGGADHVAPQCRAGEGGVWGAGAARRQGGGGGGGAPYRAMLGLVEAQQRCESERKTLGPIPPTIRTRARPPPPPRTLISIWQTSDPPSPQGSFKQLSTTGEGGGGSPPPPKRLGQIFFRALKLVPGAFGGNQFRPKFSSAPSAPPKPPNHLGGGGGAGPTPHPPFLGALPLPTVRGGLLEAFGVPPPPKFGASPENTF